MVDIYSVSQVILRIANLGINSIPYDTKRPLNSLI